MRKVYSVSIILASILSIQPVFADDAAMSSDTKPCGMVAKACLHAGYSRKQSEDKKFWSDCMKPVILGQTVKGVKLDGDTVKACREDKINELKQELSDFQNVSSN